MHICLRFSSYDTTKLTKTIKTEKFHPVLYKVNRAMFGKKCFFSVAKMLPTKSLQSLRELHC